MKNKNPDAAFVWKQLEDVLVPRLGLTLAERVVYAHLLRHSRLEGKRQLRFSIPCFSRSVYLSDATTRQAVRSLAAKGALRLIDRTMAGHLAEIFLPGEIQDAPREIPVPICLGRRTRTDNLEELNFLQVVSRREAIHVRERGRCFYCLRRFTHRGRVLDHVLPRARGGTSSYRNLVSCCVACNAQKGEMAAEDFLRSLFRQRRLSAAELEARLRALDALAAGQLRPILAPPAVIRKQNQEPEKS